MAIQTYNQKQISALFGKNPEWFGRNRDALIRDSGFPEALNWPGRKLWAQVDVDAWFCERTPANTVGQVAQTVNEAKRRGLI